MEPEPMMIKDINGTLNAAEGNCKKGHFLLEYYREN